MKNICILSDFDGTITEKDTLFSFFEKFADKKWLHVEKEWIEGKISSKECLIKEFELVANLNEELIDSYLKNTKVDTTFLDFYKKIQDKNIDFFVVSDGIDYFINKILKNSGLNNIEIISNHGEFVNGKFVLSFPNDCEKCKNNAGTCKCKIVEQKKKEYEKIIYFGDGTSDFCVANKADILFAKEKLFKYCKDKGIEVTAFEKFEDVNIFNFV